jgi:Zn-dependent protease with chaperone function
MGSFMTAWFVLQLALAWFFIVNCLASVGALAIGGVARSRGAARVEWGPATLLALRLMPAAASIFFVAALFVPAFVRLEPEGMRETIGRTGLILAAAAVAVVLIAIGRGVADARRTRRVVALWAAGATPVRLKGVRLPAYVVDTAFPVMSLVGIVRPRLFIARQVVETLTARELKSAVAHELAHLRAYDNVKRLLLSLSPDLVGWSAAGRALDASWRAAAEFAADERAVAGDRRRAVTLASTLVKVARLVANHPRVDYACAMFHDGGPIAQRVERLVQPESFRAPARSRRRVAMLALTALLVGLASFNAALPAVHSLTEILVQLP